MERRHAAQQGAARRGRGGQHGKGAARAAERNATYRGVIGVGGERRPACHGGGGAPLTRQSLFGAHDPFSGFNATKWGVRKEQRKQWSWAQPEMIPVYEAAVRNATAQIEGTRPALIIEVGVWKGGSPSM